MDVFVNYPEAKRVNYSISTNFLNINQDKVREAFKKVIPTMTYMDNDEVVKEVNDVIDRNAKRYASSVKSILDKNEELKERISDIRMTRNYNLHESIPEFIKLVADKDNPLEVRVNMAEALGWYVYSYRKQEIIDGFNKILAEDKDLDPELRGELVQTINRLK